MNLSKLQKTLQKNFLGQICLAPFSIVYGAGVFLRKKIYELGILKSRSVNVKVICVGNLTTGGTGKTTTVMFLAQMLAKQNIKVAIISRGYKSETTKNQVTILSENTADWQTAGDEPYMMYKSLEKYQIPVVVSANRYKAAQTAIDKFKSQVLLLDDGFGHFKLKRDLDIVLVDARSNFSKDALLPLGNLREPKSALRRAGLIMLTHCDLADKNALNKIIDGIKKYNSSVEIIKTRHNPTHFFDICRSEIVNLSEIGGKVSVLSAIGNPQSFEDTLKNLDLKLEQNWHYPDHHAFSLEELKTTYELKGDLPLITTYKDFVRFPLGWRQILKEKVYFLSINLDVIGGHKKLDDLKKILLPPNA